MTRTSRTRVRVTSGIFCVFESVRVRLRVCVRLRSWLDVRVPESSWVIKMWVEHKNCVSGAPESANIGESNTNVWVGCIRVSTLVSSEQYSEVKITTYGTVFRKFFACGVLVSGSQLGLSEPANIGESNTNVGVGCIRVSTNVSSEQYSEVKIASYGEPYFAKFSPAARLSQPIPMNQDQ